MCTVFSSCASVVFTGIKKNGNSHIFVIELDVMQ